MTDRRPLGAHSTPRKPHRGRSVALLVVVTMVLTAVALVATGAYLMSRPGPELAAPVSVEIPEGAGTARIAEILEEAGVVSDAFVFRVKVRLAGADGKLRAGTYEVAEGGDTALIELLLSGPPIRYVDVTIPEGFTAKQIAARLEEQAGIPAADFLALADGGAGAFVETRPYLAGAYGDKLEGYLFPKTYRIVEGSDAVSVVNMMLDQFEAEFAQVDLSAAEAVGRTPAQIVVLASMIERETMVDAERPLVSSVIENRLARGMLLQIDATIEYVIERNQVRLTYEDLKVDTPYNTYRNKGLPPGPISNPGLESLRAAANPASTDYLYYVLTSKDGSHTFTTNEADHLKAKAVSKEVFGE